MNPAVSDAILQKMHLKNADSRKQQEFLEVFEELVSQSAVNTILELIPKKEVRTFLSLTNEDKTGEKAYLFARKHIQNLDEALQRNMEQIIAKLTIQ